MIIFDIIGDDFYTGNSCKIYTEVVRFTSVFISFYVRIYSILHPYIFLSIYHYRNNNEFTYINIGLIYCYYVFYVFV